MDTQKNDDFFDSTEQSFNFGILLRQMIERMGVRQSLVADWLNCNRHMLNRVVNGHLNLNQEYIEKKNWRQIFAERCPNVWLEYASPFEQAVARLNHNKHQPKILPAHHPATVRKQWRKAVGEFVDHVLKSREDELKDLISAVQKQSLKSEKIWSAIICGNGKIRISAYQDALIELNLIYHLGSQRNRIEAEAYRQLLNRVPVGPR